MSLATESACNVAKEIDAAIAITPFVVVPADKFEESLVQTDSGTGIKDTGVLAVDEIGRDDFVRCIFEDSFEIGLRGLFHGPADFLVGGVLSGADGEVDHADGGGGDAERHSGQFSLNFRADEPDGFGCTGGRRDDVDGGGTTAFPILAGRSVDGFLGGGITVNRGHQAFLDSKTLLEEDMDEGGQTVCGTGGIRDDVVVCVVVLGVVDAHHDGDVLAFGGGGDDDFLTACGQVPFGFFSFCEEACRFNHVVDAEIFPWQGGRTFLDGETFDFVTIHHKDIVFSDGRGGFCT